MFCDKSVLAGRNASALKGSLLSALIVVGSLSTCVKCFSVSPHCTVMMQRRTSSASATRLQMSLERRHVLASILAGTSVWLPPLSTPPAQARGLVQFPCSHLENTYHFIRAGQSLMEEDNIWSTNPLFLTNRDSALSTEGIQQVEATCQNLKEGGVNPTIVMYSLAASSMDTANIIGRELRIGRDRLVPEFTYLDPRAIGKWDMLEMASTQAAMWAMDADEAGAEGRGARPPPNEDGTPNETLDNQATRLRQLLSLMETQYSGDTVLLVFPDGTGPALLSAMIAGIPYNRVHELNFCPGEVRLDVTMESTRALLKSGIVANDYKDILTEGRQELKRLRSLKPEDVVSVKDQRLESDRLEMEAFAKQVENKRRAKDEQDQKAREARYRGIEEDRQRRREEMGATSNGLDANFPLVLGAGALGVSAGAAALFGDRSTHEKDAISSGLAETRVVNTTDTATLAPGTSLDVEIMEGPKIDIADLAGDVSSLHDETGDFKAPLFASSRNETEGGFELYEESNPATSTLRVNGDRRATFPPPTKSRDPVKAAQEAMQEYLEMDDGGSEWLQMMSDLMLEEDEGDTMDEQARGLTP